MKVQCDEIFKTQGTKAQMSFQDLGCDSRVEGVFSKYKPLGSSLSAKDKQANKQTDPIPRTVKLD